jgi:hypothetical protein
MLHLTNTNSVSLKQVAHSTPFAEIYGKNQQHTSCRAKGLSVLRSRVNKLYSRRSFTWESKYRKHEKNGTVLKAFFYDSLVLNHAIVISEE